MKIETTITAMQGEACIFETDVVAHIDYDVRDGELTWRVDQYCVSGTRKRWNEARQVLESITFYAAVPEAVAKVFDTYLDREWMEEKIRDRLADSEELKPYRENSDLRAAYHAAVL